MISYEDSESIAQKAKYIIQRNLGGMMFWDLGQDDEGATLLESIYQQLRPE
jgi:chitinase